MDATLVALAINWLLAAIFALALVHKVRAWQRFKASMAAYDIVPQALVGTAGGLFAVSEALTIVALLTVQPAGTLLAALLLGIYAVAICINVLRGRTHIDCGCGDEPTPVSWGLVARNACLIALALYSLQAQSTASPAVTWLNGAVALGLSLVAFGIYSAVEQLLANRGRHQRLWLGAS